jgi:NitT/TauT family transport system substrate-binding protein
MRRVSRLSAGAVVALALVLSAGTKASADPLKIRLGVVPAPASLIPEIFGTPDIVKHAGKSYDLEFTRFQGSPVQITALAAGEIGIASLGFSTLGTAIENARMSDIRVIADEVQVGVPGYGSSVYMVANDSPIRKVEDLKGKVVATNAVSGALDMIGKAMLLQHGLIDKRDYMTVEIAFPNMKSSLLAHKVDLGVFIEPFLEDPDLRAKARALFSSADALGPVGLTFWTAREGYLAQHRAAMVDLLEDYVRALRWAWDPAHRDQAIARVAAATRQSPDLLGRYIFTHKDNYQDLNGRPNLVAIASNIHAQRELDFIKADVDVTRYADLSLVDEAAKRVGRQNRPLTSP